MAYKIKTIIRCPKRYIAITYITCSTSTNNKCRSSNTIFLIIIPHRY